ncbi:DUF4240 domain-containing protein [Actinomadura sp. 3N508]|uniref:DUF4240 domain-containing protein n=1 Tax=Actinomadura sp. 3N508 TaxID=3375153 RepID=UPI0037B279A7
MTEDEFWGLVEGARRDGGGSLARQVQLLREFFRANSVDVLLAYRDRYADVNERVFTWPIWDAAGVLLGFVSDDFFSDVRAWIISHGRAVVDRIAADPDCLADLAEDAEEARRGDAEEFGMLVWEMWEELTGDCGGGLPPTGKPGIDPTGDRIDLTDPAAVWSHFPRLAEHTGVPRPPQ